MLMNGDVQVIIPQILYEYASSFIPADGAGNLSHHEAVLNAVKQLIPHGHSLTDQLTNGWYIVLFFL